MSAATTAPKKNLPQTSPGQTTIVIQNDLGHTLTINDADPTVGLPQHNPQQEREETDVPTTEAAATTAVAAQSVEDMQNAARWYAEIIGTLKELCAQVQSENKLISNGQFADSAPFGKTKADLMQKYAMLVKETPEVQPFLSAEQRNALSRNVDLFQTLCAENEVLLRVAIDVSGRVLTSLSQAASEISQENAPYICTTKGGKYGAILKPAARKGVTTASLVEQVI